MAGARVDEQGEVYNDSLCWSLSFHSELDHLSSSVKINNWSPRLLHLQIRIIWQRSDHMGASGSPKSDRSLPSMRSGENCWSEEEKTCSRCFFQRNGESLRMVNIYEWKYQDTDVVLSTVILQAGTSWRKSSDPVPETSKAPWHWQGDRRHFEGTKVQKYQWTKELVRLNRWGNTLKMCAG